MNFFKKLFTRKKQFSPLPLKSVSGFWAELEKPIICMAPMADVTDAPFRQMFAQYGRPDVTWTEFVSADGLFLRPIIAGKGDQPINEFERIALAHGIGTDHPLLKDLIYSEAERPIVAQFFSKDPERMERAAALAVALGYDGVDINMGCPAKVICNQGAGSAMIKDPEGAQEIIQAAIRGTASKIPVSVKTRIGFNKNEIDMWLPALLAANPSAITLHARTRKEESRVPAHWEIITEAVRIRNEQNPDVFIIGNGDVNSLDEADARITETECDGVMIGRGIFGNPWLFSREVEKENLSEKEILGVMLEHTKLFDEILGTTKNFAVMKKHFKSYIAGFSEAKALRTALMDQGNSYKEVKGIVEGYLQSKK